MSTHKLTRIVCLFSPLTFFYTINILMNSNTLCNPDFVQFCNTNFIFWGASVSKYNRTSASLRLFRFFPKYIPSPTPDGPSIAKKFRVTGYPYLALVEPSESKPLILWPFIGFYEPLELIQLIKLRIRVRFLHNFQQHEQRFEQHFTTCPDLYVSLPVLLLLFVTIIVPLVNNQDLPLRLSLNKSKNTLTAWIKT